jgi:hypothetical protein
MWLVQFSGAFYQAVLFSEQEVIELIFNRLGTFKSLNFDSLVGYDEN